MDKNARIYVAGHNGLIGSAIERRLKNEGCANVITKDRSELDLTDQNQVRAFFERERIDYVFFSAAKVGGIFANNTYRAEFIYENLMMECNVIHNAFLNEVKKMVFFASADVYPKDCIQPAREEFLLDGKLENTCEPFAVAKIAGIKMCESYNRQYGTDFIVVIPPNVYGPNQHYDVMNAQVLPSLIKKFHEAKSTGAEEIRLWGTGAPQRDFLFVDDVAGACVFLMREYSGSDAFFNIGTGEGHSIKELSEIIKKTVGYRGKVVFDSSRPDGVLKKLLDTSKIKKLGWSHGAGLEEGVRLSYEAFLNELDRSRIRISRISKVKKSDKDVQFVQSEGAKKCNAQPETYKNKVVIKPWGYEFLMFENDCVAVWFLFIKSGHSTSMHCHPRKKTSLILLNGNAMSNTFLKRRYLKGGDALIVEKGVFHSTKSLSKPGISLLEIETPPDKTDLLRLEDKYGRERSGYEGISEMQTHNLNDYSYFAFEETDYHLKHSYSKERFSISFEVFSNGDEFKKHFKTGEGELYTACRGRVLDKNGTLVLDTGETQNASVFTGSGLIIPEKTVLLKTATKD